MNPGAVSVAVTEPQPTRAWDPLSWRGTSAIDNAQELFNASLATLAHVLPLEVSTTFDLAWDDHLKLPARRFYDEESRSFNARFFIKNFLKSLLVLSLVRHALNSRGAGFVDIGAGGGAASLAALLLFPSQRVVLVDESEEQLQIARCVMKGFNLLNRCSFRADTIEPDTHFGDAQIISSYWMQESASKFGLRDTARFRVFDSPVLVIDDISVCGAILPVVDLKPRIVEHGNLRFSVHPHGMIGKQVYGDGTCGWFYTDPKRCFPALL